MKNLSSLALHTEIRISKSSDLSGIMLIERASFSSPWPEEEIAKEMSQISWSRVYVAEYKNRIVGFMNFWTVGDERHLLNFAVAPEFRKRGIGKKMMYYLISLARKENATTILLEVRRSNESAISLYSAFDFLPVAVRPGYYVDNGEDAILMALNLQIEN
jgi:ribosomal-protein-alanine N-acetyltransferase